MEKSPFIHLRNHSSYSLAESTIKIEKLVQLAVINKMPAIALTDNNNMFGTLEFSLECQKNGIQPIIGTSINLVDISYKNVLAQITFLVKNMKGYENILYLSSISHTKQTTNVGITFKDILDHSSGLACYIGGELNPLLFYKLQNKNREINNFLSEFKNIFVDDFYIELQRINNLVLDEFENELIKLAFDFQIPVIASNNVKYVSQNDYHAHDALLCIANKSTINQENRIKSNPNLFFKTSNEMKTLFKDIPIVIENNFKLALKCKFYPKELKPRLPKFLGDLKIKEEHQLSTLSKKGLLLRLEKINFDNEKSNLTKKIYLSRLDYELDIINRMGFAGYFLIVADFVQWSRKNGIPVGPGRGSGAGSVVAWSLTITDLDPLKYGLAF